MAWTYGTRVNSGVQGFASGGASSFSFLYGAAVAAGTLVVLHIAASNSLRIPTSVTDDAGNTWTVDQATFATPGGKNGEPANVIATSVLTNAVTTANRVTVTVPLISISCYYPCTVDSFLNAIPAAQVQDGGADNTGTATAMSTGDTPTPSGAGDLCLAGFAWLAASVSMAGFQAGYTGLAAHSYGGVQHRLLYNLSVSTSQNVSATLQSNVSWAAAAQLYSSAVLGATYLIELDASENIGATLAITRRYARPALIASAHAGATLGRVKSRILRTTTPEGARLTKVLPTKRLSAVVSISPTLIRHEAWAIALNTAVSPAAALKITMGRRLTAVEHVAVVSLTRVPGKNFKIRIVEVVGLNKKGKYKQPPEVLQLYDLIDPYLLPRLKGATVAYMHGIFGTGVMFDIYAAYILAGGAFYVADNGLKQALDQHPAVARVF